MIRNRSKREASSFNAALVLTTFSPSSDPETFIDHEKVDCDVIALFVVSSYGDSEREALPELLAAGQVAEVAVAGRRHADHVQALLLGSGFRFSETPKLDPATRHDQIEDLIRVLLDGRYGLFEQERRDFVVGPMERGVIGLLFLSPFQVCQFALGLIDCFYQVALLGRELGDFVLYGMATVG